MTAKIFVLLSLMIFQNNSDGQFFKVETVEVIDGWMSSVVAGGEPPFYKIKLKYDEIYEGTKDENADTDAMNEKINEFLCAYVAAADRNAF